MHAHPHFFKAGVAEIYRLYAGGAVGELITDWSIRSIELVIRHYDRVDIHSRNQDWKRQHGKCRSLSD